MLALLLFVLSSSSLFLIFRGLSPARQPLLVLMFNYFFCSLFSFMNVWMEGSLNLQGMASAQWLPYALALGAGYLLNFSLTQKTVREVGASLASVATKLSLVLPFFFTLWVQKKEPGMLAIFGLLICLLSIVLCSYRKEDSINEKSGILIWMLLPAIFLGTGLTDVLTQWMNQNLVPAAQEPQMVFVVFSGAFLSAAILVLYRLGQGHISFRVADAWPGFWLGLPNFLSYKAILAALSAFQHQGNLVFPLANLGVIVCTTLVSAVWFRDRLHQLNYLGVLLALIALTLFLIAG